MSEAEHLNEVFVENPKGLLTYGDLRSAARSIWKWTWRNFTPASLEALIDRTHTPEQQRARVLIRWKKESKQAEGLRMIEAKASVEEVGRALVVSTRTVKRWKATTGR
jgi:hypothetical protein